MKSKYIALLITFALMFFNSKVQAQFDEDLPPDDMCNCTGLYLSSTSINFSSPDPSTSYVYVRNITIPCLISVRSGDWSNMLTISIGQSSDRLTITSKNNSGNARSTSVIIDIKDAYGSICGTKTLNVTQAAYIPPLSAGTISCSNTLINEGTSPGIISSFASPSGGTGSYSYQWQKSTNNSSWSNISGATNSSYTPVVLYSPTYFRRRVISGSETKYSNSVYINLRIDPGSLTGGGTINYNDVAPTILYEQPGSLESYSLVWQKSYNNTSWSNISNATGQSYAPGNLILSAYYRCKITSDGQTVYTNVIKYTVRPTTGSISGTQTINYNTNPVQLNNVTAPVGGNGSYRLNWQVSTNNSSWSDISGATAITYTPGKLTNSRYYRRKVTSDGVTVYSSSVKVTVRPTSGGISGAKTINYNTSASTLSSTSNALGGNGSYTYQWQVSSDNSSWSNISGATSTSYSPGNLTNSRYYRRRVYSDGNSAYTGSVKITVKPTSGGISGSQTINYNTTAASLGNTSNPLGGNGSYTYQWQVSINNADWNNISGATTSTYSPGKLTASRYYRRRVFSDNNYAYTGSVHVTVKPTAGSISGVQTINYNTTCATLANSSSPLGGNGSYTYQWQVSTNNEDWNNISGATARTYSPGKLTASRYYRRRVFSDENYAYTGSIKVTVKPTAGSISGAQTINYNTSCATLANSSNPLGGNDSYTYQWQVSTNNEDWNNISGATASAYSPGKLTASSYYRRRVFSDGNYAYTGSIKVTVKPTAGSITGAQTINYNASCSTLGNSSSPLGGDGIFTYQWQQSSNNSDWSNIPGAISSTYNPGNLSNSHYFRRVVDSDGNTAYSSSVKVKVRPYAGSISGNQIVIYNGTVEELLSIEDAVGGDGTYNYQWQCSTDNTSWQNISGANSNTYTPTNLDSDLYFRRNVISDELTGSSNSIYIQVALSFASSEENYIKVILPQEAIEDNAEDASQQNLPKVTIAYFDGLGRPSQTILVGESPKGKDIIQYFEYDELGRESKKYLPFAADNSGGGFNSGAKIQQDEFYKDMFNSPVESVMPWSESIYENSPLNRVLEQGAPGYDWQPAINGGGGKTVNIDYQTNSAGEVRLFEVNLANNTVSYAGYYPGAQLYVTQTTDENGNTSKEYTDKLGQVILKKSYVTINSQQNSVETYYVYDDYGLLRYVLPPKAISALNQGTAYDTTMVPIKGLCYYYEYDQRKRMIIKKLPGADAVYMVYDQRDRLVLTQDGNMRVNNEWLFTKYDAFNRPVMTGYCYTETTHADLQAQVMTIGESDHTYALYESKDNPVVLGYTNDSYPNVSNESEYLTVTYYDGYDLGDGYVYDYIDYPEFTETSKNDKVKGQVTATRVKVFDANNDKWLTTVNFYDDKYRLIQSQMWNYMGGTDVVTTEYDFVGKVEFTKYEQYIQKAGQEQGLTVWNYNTYDHAGRLTKVEQEIEGDANGKVTLALMEYDELGQLKKKTLKDNLEDINYTYNIRGWLTSINDPHNFGHAKYAMKLHYNQLPGYLEGRVQYNGNISAMEWIHKTEEDVVTEVTYANQAIDFEKVVSGTITVKAGTTLLPGAHLLAESAAQVVEINSELMAYMFDYDELNRLTKADYLENTEGTWNNPTVPDMFDVSSIGYDKNGNITALAREGATGIIDNLTYHYNDFTNQLRNVEDAGDALHGFKDITNGASVHEYSYDQNGNMYYDENKGIDDIYYNMLNLPEMVYVESEDTIEYIYDASGIKLAKVIHANNISDTTFYMGGMQYDTDRNLLNMAHAEGNVRSIGAGEYVYEFHLKDHLGNIRAIVEQDETGGAKLTEANNYYPFGMRFNQAPAFSHINNKYLYNGKELQNDVAGTVSLDWYDYGARMYDPALGRFHTQDPALELYYEWTPYNYVGNNPIRRTDPTGMVWADSTAANDLKDAAQTRINQYEKANARIDKKIDKASEKGNDKRVSNLMERQGRNNSSIKELESSITQIDAMGADQNHTFEFQKVSGDGAHYVKQASNGNIVIQYSSTAIQLHETRHAYQYMTDKGNNWRWDSQGRLAPSGGFNSMVNWGYAEQSAYRVQYAYSSSSMPNSSVGSLSTIYDVNYKWVGGINSTYQKFMPYMNQHEKIKIMQQKAARRKFFNSL